jgi:threonine/homoserine/homoserine lactone efflux protein
MHWYSHLLAVASVWLVAAVTPGPNFLVAAQIAVARSRASGLAAVSGIAVATAVWGLCGLLGIQALFLATPWAYLGLKFAGAAYLVFTGIRLIVLADRRAREQAPPTGLTTFSAKTAFRIGLVTSLANPNSALSVASLFAVALPPHPTAELGASAIALMVAISVAWYAAVVWLFAAGAVAGAYRKARRRIDRVAGGLLVLFGVRIALDRG